MNDRFKFRAGFTVSFYDIAGNDIERQIILDSCFSIDNGGEGICVNEEIIQEALDIYVAKDEHKSAWDFINANYAETDGYYFIDNIDFLEQCTGLKDRNGKLIYEGDIVKIIDKSSRKEPFIGVVEYTNTASFEANCNGFYMHLHNPKTPENVSMIEKMFCTSLREIEIIGNIHENKELLNG